ncbi:MAG: O-antigen ligase family protein [Candidatus Eisenbacteria bacterium]|nr:O-antigen ligase family protein [Candidatus Eisenbacteria bacterium]
MAVVQGWVIAKKFAAGAVLTLAILVTCILLFGSEISPVLVLLGAYNFLGFVDPNTFARIPGIFKLRDLLLLSTVFVASIRTFFVRGSFNALQVFPVRATFTYLTYVILVAAYTVAAGHGTLNLALRVAEPYFYYLVMIPVIVFVSSRRKLSVLLVALLALSLVSQLVMVFPFITHHSLSPFTGLSWTHVGGVNIPRTYVLSFHLTGVVLLCLFGIYLYSPSKRTRDVSVASGVAVFSGVILTFGRAFWIGTVGSVLFLFALACVHSNKRGILLKRIRGLWLKAAAAAALTMIFLAIIGKEGLLLRSSDLIGQRFASTFSDVAGVKGSFGIRLEDGAFRIELFKQNPLFGVGYVHESSEFAAELPRRDVQTGDSGVITVLAQAGLVGLAAICALIAIFLKRGLSIFKRVRNPLLKGVSLGIVSFYVQAIIMFAGLTGTAFTDQAGICTIGLAVGLQEVLLRVDGESTQA